MFDARVEYYTLVAGIVRVGPDGVEIAGSAQCEAEAAAVSVKVLALFQLSEPPGARDRAHVEVVETEIELKAGACLILGPVDGYVRSVCLTGAMASRVVLEVE